MKIDSLLYIECRSDRDECRKSVRKGAKKATLHFHCRNCFTYNAREKHRVCMHAKKCTTRKLSTEKVGKRIVIYSAPSLTLINAFIWLEVLYLVLENLYMFNLSPIIPSVLSNLVFKAETWLLITQRRRISFANT